MARSGISDIKKPFFFFTNHLAHSTKRKLTRRANQRRITQNTISEEHWKNKDGGKET